MSVSSGITVYPGFGCSGGFFYTYSPNPVADNLTVEALDVQDNKPLPEGILVDFETVLLDNRQVIVLKASSTDNKIILNIKDLKKGTYYLKILDGARTIIERVIID